MVEAVQSEPTTAHINGSTTSGAKEDEMAACRTLMESELQSQPEREK